MPDLSTFSATPAAKNGSPESSLVAVLERIEQRLARLEGAVERVDTVARPAPGALATLTDTPGRRRCAPRRVRRRRRRAHAHVAAPPRAVEGAASGKRHRDPARLEHDRRARGRSVGKVADALAAEADHEPAAVGPWGAFRALGDRDVQHALGFLLANAKRLGASFAQPAPKELPPASKKR